MMRQTFLARLGVLAVLLASPAMAAAEAEPRAAIMSGKAATSLLLDVVQAGDRLVAVGERGHVLFSDDAGVSWTQASVPTRVLLTAAWFSDAKTGWAVGHDSTVLHTRDGGETWQLQHRALFDADAVDAELDEDLAGEDDFGDDFDDAGDDENASRATSQAQRTGAALLDLWFDASGQHGLAVGAYGLVLETRDGGATWTDRSDLLANLDGWHLTAIAESKPGQLLVVGEKGVAFASRDGGRSFAKVKTPAESSLFGVTGHGGVFWAVGLQGHLYRIEGGWQRVSSGVTYVLNDAAVLDDGTLVAVGNGGMVVSVPRGGKAQVVRRADRKAVTGVIAVKDGLVLVGEGGATRARADGSAY